MTVLSVLLFFVWSVAAPTAEPRASSAPTPAPIITLLPQTGAIDLNGPDYVATSVAPFAIPQTFAPDPKNNEMNLITAWKSQVEGLGNVAIVYFRATSDTMSDETLNAQVAGLWDHYSKVVATSELDVFILRGVNSKRTKICSYIYVPGIDGAWRKNHDASFVDRVIKAGI